MIAALSGCMLFDGARSVRRAYAFSHRAHVEQDLACTDCHMGAETADVHVYPELAKANLLRMRGEFKLARDACLSILKRYPGNATAHTLLGDISDEEGDLPQAAEWYEMALDITPDSEADLRKLDRVRSRMTERDAIQTAQQLGLPAQKSPAKWRVGHFTTAFSCMIQPNQLRLIPPSDNPQRAKQKPNWRERRRALRYVPALLRMVWETHRGYAATMVLLRIVRAFVPLATLWVGKLIIDAVLAMTKSSNPDWVYLWELVALELGVVVLGELLARASSLVESLLGDLFSNHTSIRLMQHAATLDLCHFEDPAFYDRMERARRQTVGRISLVGQILTMGQNIITLISLSAAIVAYKPSLLLLLAAAVVPSFLGETHFDSLEYALLYRWTPERRQLDYLRYVGASDETAKEVQMFGLAPWLIERYRLLSDKFYDQNKRLSIRKAWVASALSFFGTLGYYGAYVLILVKAAQGLLTIGTLTFLASSFARSRDLIGGLLMGFSGVVEQSMYLKDLFEFFEVEPTLTAPSNAPQVPQPIREGFLFQDVGFRYPDSERWAVRHLNFTLRPGERIALVGENGRLSAGAESCIWRFFKASFSIRKEIP